MFSSDVAFFSALNTEIENVEHLTGNSGKQVRRVLERFMPLGVIDVELAAPRELSLFAFACYIDDVMGACSMATDAMGYVKCYKGTFSVTRVSAASRSYRLRVDLGVVPETMRARQQFLKDLSHGLSRLRVMLDPALGLCGDKVSSELEEDFFRGLFSDSAQDNTTEARNVAYAQFETFVGGDFSLLDTAYLSIVHIAGIINPAATVALSEANARDAQLMDEVWEKIALEDLRIEQSRPPRDLRYLFEKQVRHIA